MQQNRTWPMPTAIAALVLFALLIPLACVFLGLWTSFSLPGGTPPSDDARDVTRGLFIAGAVSALVAIGMALASAIAGRGVAVRVVAVIAILIALVTGGFQGLMLLSEARATVRFDSGPVEPVGPTVRARIASDRLRRRLAVRGVPRRHRDGERLPRRQRCRSCRPRT